MQCPNCRRTVNEEACCPRCGTELTVVRQLHSLADVYYNAGQKALQAQDFAKALTAFKSAFGLEHSERAQKGMSVTLIGLGKNRMRLKGML